MTSLTAVVLSSNLPLLHLLQGLPVPSSSVRDGGEMLITLDLTRLDLPADRSRVAAAHVAEADVIRGTLRS